MLNEIVAFNANTGEVVWSHPQLPQNPQYNIHPNTPIHS
jgi:outer membrane protein assembly factor BamB